MLCCMMDANEPKKKKGNEKLRRNRCRGMRYVWCSSEVASFFFGSCFSSHVIVLHRLLLLHFQVDVLWCPPADSTTDVLVSPKKRQTENKTSSWEILVSASLSLCARRSVDNTIKWSDLLLTQWVIGILYSMYRTKDMILVLLLLHKIDTLRLPQI